METRNSRKRKAEKVEEYSESESEDDDYEDDADDEEDSDSDSDDYDDSLILSKLKKTDPELYGRFIRSKNIIKSREIGIQDILKADIPDERRANLIEQFECLCTIEPCTEEYLVVRDRIRNMYSKYITETYLFKPSFVPASSPPIPLRPDTENTIFKKKISKLICSDANRKILEEKADDFDDIDKGDEKSKLKRWINSALTLPFDKITTISDTDISEKIKNAQDFLDKKLYGMKNVKERILLFLNKKLREGNTRGCNIALVGKPGVGKCLHPETKIIMFDLTLKQAKDVRVGDRLLGDDGTEREVLSTTSGREEMFEVHQELGDMYIVNKSHILTLRDFNDQENIIDIPLTEVLEKGTSQFSPISAGYNGHLSVADANDMGLWFSSSISAKNKLEKKYQSFPNDYLCWDIGSKMEFYSGLIDGSEIVQNSGKTINIFIPKNQPYFSILRLLRSAGLRCIYDNNFIKVYDFLLNQKEVIEIKSIGEGDYCGFTLNGNERFVLADWTITHNTAIAKGLSECLNIPFSQLSFGGVSNADFLMGHDYTYVGSRPGEITRCLTRMGSKNGILFFDEFDKAADKKDIMSTLLHITDFSQNNEFRDNYFPELTQDLSKIWFIYSMNNLPTDPAMLDRLEIINVEEYSADERRAIAKDYLFPKYTSELKIKDKIIIDESGLKKIVDYASGGCDKKGVRNLERFINLVIEKIYFFLCNKDNTGYSYPWYKKIKESTKEGKVVITESLVSKILEETRKESESFMNMYL
jgi:Hom_end-associated Hint/ATPase family associated with various cellular activities (AAA)